MADNGWLEAVAIRLLISGVFVPVSARLINGGNETVSAELSVGSFSCVSMIMLGLCVLSSVNTDWSGCCVVNNAAS